MMKKRLLILLLTIFSFSYTSIVFGSSNDTTDCEDCETLGTSPPSEPAENMSTVLKE